MKNILLTFSLLASALISQAQNSSISGSVVDSLQNPLEFINVVAFAASDSSMLRATATDNKGKFVLDHLPAGKCFVKCVYMGLSDFSSAVIDLAEGETKSMETVRMQSFSAEMQAVEVVFKKPLVQVQADRTVFNVEGTVNSTGLNAMELLKKAPGVMVDNNDNITVKGRSGVLIYIDGKVTPLDEAGLAALLKSMQSSNIESIEIITNPSSKYDAAGSAGIINIKLKKNKSFGTNGNVQVGYGVQLYSKYNGSFSLNHRTEKWNMYGQYGMNTGKSWHWMDFNREQTNYSDSLLYRYNQTTRNTSNMTGHNFKTGVDRFINARNTIGVMVSGNISHDDWVGNSNTDISNETENYISSILRSRTQSVSDRQNINGNINYHYTDTAGVDLVADLDYGDYQIRSNSYQPNTYSYPAWNLPDSSVNYRFITPIDISIMSAKLDYERNLWGGKLGAGGKVSKVATRNTMNRYDVYNSQDVLDSALSNRFNYDEVISAAYLNFKGQKGRISYQFGLRGEQTKSEGDLKSFITLSDESDRTVSRSYFSLFPSGGITYNVNDTNQFALTFSRRIDRPSYQDLNPFEFKLDELSYQKGNPFLRPQYGHVGELTYTYMYAVSASLAYSYNDDFMTSVTDTAGNRASFIQTQNLGYEEWLGFSLNSPLPLGKKVNGFLGLNVGRKHVKADFNEIDIVIWSYSAFAQCSISLPKATTVELSGWFSGPSVWGGTFVTRRMGSMDVAVRKDFLDGDLNLRMALGDVFYTSIWRSESTIPQLHMNGSGGWESRQFRVSLSYNFGNQQLKMLQRKSGADDLNSRVK